MAMERTHNDPFTFEIVEHLLVISTKEDGWSKELNLVSWNGQQPPKFDLREWTPDHTKMSKGITLFDSEMRRVAQAYFNFCNARKVSEGRNNRNAAAEAGLRAGKEAALAQEEEKREARDQAMENAEAIRSMERQDAGSKDDDFDMPGGGETGESAASEDFAALSEAETAGESAVM